MFNKMPLSAFVSILYNSTKIIVKDVIVNKVMLIKWVNAIF